MDTKRFVAEEEGLKNLLIPNGGQSRPKLFHIRAMNDKAPVCFASKVPVHPGIPVLHPKIAMQMPAQDFDPHWP